MKQLSGTLIWESGLKDKAQAIDLHTLQNVSASWRHDIKDAALWRSILLPIGGRENKFRVFSEDCPASLIIISGPCASSMDLAWHFIQNEQMPAWGSVLALRQWAGRGQLGRQWVSPVDNIYAACRLPRISSCWIDLLPLIVGFALQRSFSQLGIDMQLKWPNDLIIKNTKVGGVLMENKGNAIVAGIGLNLSSSPDQNRLRKEKAIGAASLSDFGYHFTPLSLWRNLIREVRNHFDNITRTDDPSQFIKEVQPCLAFAGRQVTVFDHDGSYHATLVGLSENGGLELITGTQTKTIQSGSILPLD
ncbi:MAG: biotin--[acetyl-CoA-carboxylase] ligase [Proteobacteria bacterium]|nr:biotin--[acetyl-CoA-carboxylase] ligase [Pseudomonadota bacterium]MBU1389888.1 biotin--[acetyl-CoA-carboxylase] ligase [Pseudomonadota bacterium]MBU1543897.1 biotin--[acetyl-CoA-carboxylase] ligase [Pseudomonadota bacterium]MBU2431250.1 biotin--[acetyl-CoA-carboxylase] ligase [Pseudomonadota bacterium]MBU2479917.1 biotin--[acetyl-CoA-carboxylase] ligase [Pseudomonadota bacterium]